MKTMAISVASLFRRMSEDQADAVLVLHRYSLPLLYFSLILLWIFSTFHWIAATWTNRRSRQMSTFHTMLALVLLSKVFHLMQYLIFWYSCINFDICTLWSLGVIFSGILFNLASSVSFMLIHYYCMYELSPHSGRRQDDPMEIMRFSFAGFFKYGIPYFKVFLGLTYAQTIYAYFSGYGNNQPGPIGDDDVERKTMFRKFRFALLIGSVLETYDEIFIQKTAENLFFRMLFRELVHFCILMYIGSIFTSPDLLRPRVLPLYTVEMNASDFSDLRSQESHIGHAVPFPSMRNRRYRDSTPVVVRHPH